MEFLEILKAVLFGMIQGITEWLPISSTGHMLLLDELVHLNVSQQFLEMFLVVIQFGSILAVITLYFHKLNPLSPKKTREQKRDTWSLWSKVLVAAVPGGIIGLLFDDVIHEKLYGPVVIAITLILYGVLFIVIENRKRRSSVNDFKQLTYQMALFIGVFQILALIPGTSRSGATIVGAILLGTSRFVAAEFSFFLAIPMMVGASGYSIVKFLMGSDAGFTGPEWTLLIVGSVVAYVVSIFAIKFLMNFIKKHDFKPFGWYRIILGIIILGYFLLLAK